MATVYRNKQMMCLSVLLFFYFASIGCLSPFLTAHMRHLGFTLSEISFINAVSAFFSLIGPVLGGTFAERRNCYKFTTVFCVLFGSLAFVALSFVPRFDKLNYRPLVDFDCDAGLRVEKCVNWASCGEAFDASENLTTVKLSECHYQCPQTGHFTSVSPLHLCFRGDSGNRCVVFDDDSLRTQFDSHVQSWPYKEVRHQQHIPVSHATLSANVTQQEDVPRAHVATCRYMPLGSVTFERQDYAGIHCRPSKDDCSIHCKVSFESNSGSFHPRQCEEAYGSPTRTFWTYLILRSIGDLCLLTVVCLLDAIAIWSTADYEGSYGRIHIWAALGVASLSPLSGSLLDHYTDDQGSVNYTPSAFLSFTFALICCVLMIISPINRQQKSDLPYKSNRNRFFTLEMVVFLIVVLLLGMQWSILFTFLPWMTMDIGCSSLQTGLASTLMFGFAVPFLLISKNMIRNIGSANLLVFAFLFYFTRYAGITFVQSPWWTLPFALMGSFTLCVMWIAAVAYGQKLTPPGYSLIMQYVLNMAHFGIGRGLGSLAGGAMTSMYSQKSVFCGIAIFSALMAFFYLTIYHWGLRKHKSFPAQSNGSMYPLQVRSNGKSHQPITVDDDLDSNHRPNNK